MGKEERELAGEKEGRATESTCHNDQGATCVLYVYWVLGFWPSHKSASLVLANVTLTVKILVEDHTAGRAGPEFQSSSHEGLIQHTS